MSTRLKALASAPSGSRPGKGRVVDVARNASIDQVLENFESAGGKRNGTIGVKRSGATIALGDRNNQSGLPSRRNSETQDEVEEGKQKMTPPWE